MGQLQLIVATTLASTLAAGSVAAFAIAYTVYLIPVGTIGVPLGVVALPALTTRFARGEAAEYASLLVKTVRLMLFVMLPMTGVAIVLRTELVTILFNYGRFDARAVALTSDTLLFLLPGLAADGLNVLLARAVYSRGGTWAPVVSGTTELAITIVAGAALVGTWGLSGIAAGFAIGAWAETVILLGAILATTRALDVASLARGTVTFLVAAAGATVVAWLVERGMYTAGFDAGKIAALVQLIVAGGAAVAAYAAIALVLRVPELPDTLRLAVGALRRERPATT